LGPLLDVVAAESQRFRCLVVGEDLGTMPEGIRERLAEKYILSYRVLYFERGPDGAFLPPSAYPVLAVATVTTHDLPTLAGYWSAHDLDIRARLGLFLSPSRAQEERDGRARDRDALVAALRAEGLLTTCDSPSAALDQATVDAVHGYLARTPSRLAIIHIEDMLRTEDQPNVPGTPDAPPNWRRKLDIALEDLARDQRIVRIGEIMREGRSQTNK
jgi:4-alpha-glucanotransferase